jgi:PKD repeat protein
MAIFNNQVVRYIRRLICILSLMFYFYNTGTSQLSIQGIPYSFQTTQKSAKKIATNNLQYLDIKKLIAQDSLEFIDNRYGIHENIDIDIKLQGSKTTIAGKGHIWQYTFVSPNAYSLGIEFSQFKQLAGAFSKLNNKESNRLALAEFLGNNVTIEYFEPLNPEFEGQLHVGSISQAYRNVLSILNTVVDINCAAGTNWQTEKHAVCRMTFSISGKSYYCSGALVNNTRADGTPYFLTASHCINTAASATSLVIYFNYESNVCNSSVPFSNINQTLSGATLLTNNKNVDYSLLLMNENPPTNYKAYFAGWDASGRISQNTAGIHHPEGTKKSISIDNNPVQNYPFRIKWDDTFISDANTHWRAIFETGIIQGGSSGSPLFDDRKRIIGQLHGGSEDTAFYGKFNLSWTLGVSQYLDRDKTGKTSLDGFGFPPTVDFQSNLLNICYNTPITLTDLSKNYPTNWKWEFSTSHVVFLNGTNFESENPKIAFTEPGIYSITLTASNTAGISTVTKTNYITVKNTITTKFSRYPNDSILCGKDLSSFAFVASGTQNYQFSSSNTTMINVIQKFDTAYFSVKTDTLYGQSFYSHVKVYGSEGSCNASDSIQLKIVMPIKNDNSKYPVELKLGMNGPYSNYCAGYENNEPHPRTIGCTSDKSWCYDSGNRIAEVNNTLWFKFKGTINKTINIDTKGFNTRVAIYEADSTANLFSGNELNYKLLAANDDRSNTDNSSLITNLKVNTNTIYWLQLDGFKGAYGNALFNLYSNSIEFKSSNNKGVISIIISSATESTTATIELYSSLGQLMMQKKVSVTPYTNIINFNLTGYASGIYHLVYRNGNEVFNRKILIAK